MSPLIPICLSSAENCRQIRQVPDSQEVYVASDSDSSFVLEILQRVPPESQNEAIQFLFDALAHDNEASSSSPLTLIERPADADASLTMATGTQRIRKFNQTEEDKVQILMAVYRLESRGVDLVLTNNVPFSKETSQSPDINLLKQTFLEIAQSLRVVDHNLFA